MAGEGDRHLLRLLAGLISRWLADEPPTPKVTTAENLAKLSGLPRQRAVFEWIGSIPEPRLRVTLHATRSLDLDLSLWKGDSRLGDPELRVALPQRLAAEYRATSREPLSCARLFSDEVAEELLRLALVVESLQLDDHGMRFVVDIREPRLDDVNQAIVNAARTGSKVIDQIEARRRLLPRSDYAPALERTWQHFAAQHGASFDPLAETLTLTTAIGELAVCVATVERRRCTLLELRFAAELPFAFELVEKSELKWFERLQRPLISDPERDVALYQRGASAGAGQTLTPAAERALAELRAACDAVHLSNVALLCRSGDVLTDALEHAVELVLEAGEALCMRAKHAAGPYR